MFSGITQSESPPTEPEAAIPEAAIPEATSAFVQSDWTTFFDENGQLREEAFQGDNARYIPAAVTRQQWQQYQERFVPWEDALLDKTYYNNPVMVDQAVGRGTQAASSAIDTAQGVQQRRLSSMGQTVGAQSQGRIDSSWDRERALNQADAANRIRQNIAANSRNTALGGTASAPAIPMPQGG